MWQALARKRVAPNPIEADRRRERMLPGTRERTMKIATGIVEFAFRWAVPLGFVGLLCLLPPVASAKERRDAPNVPMAAQPSPPEPAPAALPVREPAPGPLGAALAACDKDAESAEPLTLPGAKGEVRLDRCYRGRDHLVCSFNALLKEAKSLIDNYAKIVEARYPEVSNVDGICTIKPDNLAADLQNAGDFTARFKTLKAEYDARTSCAARIGQSLRDVTLPDMAQAPGILKSMIESIDGDAKGVSVVQAKVVEIAERIDSSQKAMVTIRKIHRTMCLKDQRAVSQTEDRASR
jgi:hypothetical protein